MKVIKVKCSYTIPVVVDDDYYNSEFTPEFDIEENHCPATGLVGAEFDRLYKEHERNGTCWACGLGGECEIISIEDKVK